MFEIWRIVPVVAVILGQICVGGAFICAPSCSALVSRSPTNIPGSWRRYRRGHGDPCGRRRERTDPFAKMLFEKRPEERALGDIMVTEERPPADGDGNVQGVLIEPPGVLKRLFSVPKNVRRTAAVGDVVVPVIGARDNWGGIRQGLANRGIFPGVEYRILDVSLEADSASSSSIASAREAPEGSFDDGELVFTMRPVYPLVARLERTWPVRVPAREFPVMLAPFSYNAATAWAALTTSISLLAVGFVISQALTLSVIPSHSMEPTLQVNDVVLVEKVSHASVLRRDDIVFFNPPPALREVVSAAGGTLNTRDLFVKRVAGLPGDTVSVSSDGTVSVQAPASNLEVLGGASPTAADEGLKSERYSGGGRGKNTVAGAKREALPDSVLQRLRVTEGKVLPRNTAFVLGDNPAASMDSRVWGELDEREIVGHALLRVFPPEAFGLLP